MRQSTPRATTGELRALLRQWREFRHKSQLELSVISGISQRHLSFIESGRSVPSRDVIVRIAGALDVPYRERNALLLAAGYAPLYDDAGWESSELEFITQALRRVLRQHEPYPAVALDRHWNVVLTNASAPRFFGQFVDLESRPKPRNLLQLLFDPNGLRPFIGRWEELAGTLIGRVHREAVGGILDAKSQQLLDDLLAYPGTRAEWRTQAGTADRAGMPVIPIEFIHGVETLRYFSMLTTLATPQTIATQELRIECMFPFDEATERSHATLMGLV